jgi:hypothetical protein
MRTTEWWPGKPVDYDDHAPSRDEARRDEAALRRRKPVPRDPDDPTPLLDALTRATSTVQAEYRRQYAP